MGLQLREHSILNLNEGDAIICSSLNKHQAKLWNGRFFLELLSRLRIPINNLWRNWRKSNCVRLRTRPSQWCHSRLTLPVLTVSSSYTLFWTALRELVLCIWIFLSPSPFFSFLFYDLDCFDLPLMFFNPWRWKLYNYLDTAVYWGKKNKNKNKQNKEKIGIKKKNKNRKSIFLFFLFPFLSSDMGVLIPFRLFLSF